MTVEKFFSDFTVALAVAAVLLVLRVVARILFDALRKGDKSLTPYKALQVLGKWTWYAAISLLSYGFILRPILSKEQLRDEVAVIPPGVTKTYDVDLRRGSRKVIGLEFAVLKGSPVHIALIPFDALEEMTSNFRHIKSFSIMSANSGATSARVEAGLWSIALTPADPSGGEDTRVHIETYVRRPRFFERKSTLTHEDIAQAFEIVQVGVGPGSGEGSLPTESSGWLKCASELRRCSALFGVLAEHAPRARTEFRSTAEGFEGFAIAHVWAASGYLRPAASTTLSKFSEELANLHRNSGHAEVARLWAVCAAWAESFAEFVQAPGVAEKLERARTDLEVTREILRDTFPAPPTEELVEATYRERIMAVSDRISLLKESLTRWAGSGYLQSE